MPICERRRSLLPLLRDARNRPGGLCWKETKLKRTPLKRDKAGLLLRNLVAGLLAWPICVPLKAQEAPAPRDARRHLRNHRRERPGAHSRRRARSRRDAASHEYGERDARSSVGPTRTASSIFPGLPPGHYRIEITQLGFEATHQRSRLHFTSSCSRSVDAESCQPGGHRASPLSPRRHAQPAQAAQGPQGAASSNRRPRTKRATPHPRRTNRISPRMAEAWSPRLSAATVAVKASGRPRRCRRRRSL